MTEHHAPEPVEAHILAQLRGDLTDDDAAHTAAVARAAPWLLDKWPVLRQALAEGDHRWPADARRFAPVQFGSGPVEADPATTAALVRMMEPPDAAPATGPEGPSRARKGRRRALRVVEGDGAGDGDGNGRGPGGGGGGGDGPGGGPERAPAPGPALPSMRGGALCYSTEATGWARGVYHRARADGRWELVAPLPHVLGRVPRRTSRGTIRWHEFILSATASGEGAVLVTPGELRDGTWAQRLDLVLSDDDKVQRAATSAIRAVAEAAPRPELAARWEGGRLVLPPVETLPTGYLTTAGTEAQARGVWAEVGQLACQPGAENLALNLGASCAGPYVEALTEVRPVSFALVGVGAPRRGKTTNTNAAAGWWGDPLGVNPVLSESPIALGELAGDLGCLPVFRDEAHAGGWTPVKWHENFMRNLNGAGRRRAAQTGAGQVSSTPPWWGVQFFTGNVDPRYGATDGVQARVVVLNDPHLPDKRTARRVTALLARGYGWPCRWQLADHPTPERFAELVEAARELLPGDLDGSADTVADSLALCIAGAQLAGELIGAPELAAAATRGALRVLSTLNRTIADAPPSFGDRLLADAWDDAQAHPQLYPRRADYAAMTADASDRDDPPAIREVHGIRWNDDAGRPVLSLVPAFYRELDALTDYSLDAAHDELRQRGLVMVTRGAGRRHDIRLSPHRRAAQFYTLHAPPEPAPDPEDEDEGPDPAPAPAPAQPELLPPPPEPAPSAPAERPEAPPGPVVPAASSTAASGAQGPESGWTVVALGDGWIAHRGRRQQLAADLDLPAILARLDRAAPPGPVSLVIDSAVHERYGLPVDPAPAPVLAELAAAGFHRPGHPGQAALVPLDRATRPICPTLTRARQAGTFRLVPARWLGARDFPRHDDDPGAPVLADRLDRFHDRTPGWVHEGSSATTCLRVMRDLAESTSGPEPRWQGGAPWRANLDRRPVPHTEVSWRRELTRAEKRATGVLHLDAVRNYLAGYHMARWSRSDLRYDPSPRFDPDAAGILRFVVPAMPDDRVPPPVLAPVGTEAWATTDRLRLYDLLGIRPELIDGWTAPVDQLTGTRSWQPTWRQTFARQVVEVLDAIDALGDSADDADRAVYRALKDLYKRGHGKLRTAQRIIHRADWGWAIQDYAWFAVCYRTYQAAGLVSLPGGRRAEAPRYPVSVSTDEIAYAGTGELVVPEGFTVANRLGGFRLARTLTVAEWKAEHSESV